MDEEVKTVFSITSSSTESFSYIFDLEGLDDNDLHVVHSLLQLSCVEIQKFLAETVLEITDEDLDDEGPEDNTEI